MMLLLAVMFGIMWMNPNDERIPNDKDRFESFSWMTFFFEGGGLQVALLIVGAIFWWICPRTGNFTLQLAVSGVMLLGWPLWEYLIHRYEMHEWRNDPLYDPHQAHHEYPFDGQLALMPMRQFYFSMFLVSLFVWLEIPALLSGFTTAMLMLSIYELVHYSTHTNYRPKTRIGRRILRNHRKHHFIDESKNMNVLFPRRSGR